MLFVHGCDIPEMVGKVTQVILDPDVPVGELEDRPSVLKTVAFVDPSANTDFFGQPIPLTFSLVSLTGPRTFSRLSEQQAIMDLEGALGDEMIDIATHMVAAGDFIALEPFELDPGTNFLGVVALYAEPDGKQWRALEPMVATGVTYDILVRASREGITIQTNSEL